MVSPADYREQDIADLMETWRKSIDVLKFVWCSETASRAQQSFDEILNYLHAGEPPWEEDGPDDVLVRIIKESPR